MRMLVAACLFLVACDHVGAPPPMTLDEARANVSRVASNGTASAFCTPEGQVEFRRAVRALSAAHEAEGQDPVNLMETSDEVWGLVLIGVLAKIVKPSDLSGEMAGMASVWGFANGIDGDVRLHGDALRSACPEVITVYRLAADAAQLEERYEHMNRRGDRGAAERAGRRLAVAHERLREAGQRLQRKLEASGANF